MMMKCPLGFGILALLSATLMAQDGPRRTKPRTPDEHHAHALATVREFDELSQKYRDTVLRAFDRLLDGAEKSRALSISDRALILGDLREAREKFENGEGFTPILAMHLTYRDYIAATRTEYIKTCQVLDKAWRSLGTSDPRRSELESLAKDLASRVNKLDALQPGTTWTGYRMDFRPPPRVEFSPGTSGKFRVVQDQAGSVEFSLRILSRKGDEIVGEISQAEGRFKAEVVGTFDGLSLRLWMTGVIKRGYARHFVYAGEVVGELGMLNLEGIKTDQKYTTGMVVLARE